MTQYLIILGGDIIDVVVTSDIDAHLKAKYAFPESFVAIKDEPGCGLKEAKIRSVELLKANSEKRGVRSTDQQGPL